MTVRQTLKHCLTLVFIEFCSLFKYRLSIYGANSNKVPHCHYLSNNRHIKNLPFLDFSSFHINCYFRGLKLINKQSNIAHYYNITTLKSVLTLFFLSRKSSRTVVFLCCVVLNSACLQIGFLLVLRCKSENCTKSLNILHHYVMSSLLSSGFK